MLGSPCSPCCSSGECSDLWQALSAKSCAITATLNVPRGDPATEATFGYASDLGNTEEGCANFTKYGYVRPYSPDYLFEHPASTTFYEGNDALSSLSLQLSLDLSATSWNSQASTGMVTFKHAATNYTVTLAIQISPGPQGCVAAASFGFNMIGRVAVSSEGAGLIGGATAQTIGGLGPGSVYWNVPCALASSTYYQFNATQLASGYSSANGGVSPGFEKQLIYLAARDGVLDSNKFCTVTSWWTENKNTDSTRLTNQSILLSAFSLGNLSQAGDQWAASGDWSGSFANVPRQWKEYSASDIWASAISLESPYPNTSYRFADFRWPAGGYIGSSQPIVACGVTTTTTRYAPATFDDAYVSASVVLS